MISPTFNPVGATDTAAKTTEIQAKSLLPFYPNATIYRDAGGTNSAVQSASSSSL